MVVLFDNQSLVIAGILTPFVDEMITAHVLVPADFKGACTDALVKLINSRFFGSVDLNGFGESVTS
jgi:hypothetical protein